MTAGRGVQLNATRHGWHKLSGPSFSCHVDMEQLSALRWLKKAHVVSDRRCRFGIAGGYRPWRICIGWVVLKR